MKLILEVFLLLGLVAGCEGQLSATSYVVIFMKQFYHKNSSPFYPGLNKIILSSPVAATATINIPSISYTKSVTLSAGHPHEESLVPLLRMVNGTDTYYVATIIASTSISAYAVNVGDISSDGTLLYPVSQLGTEYYLASYDPYLFGAYGTVVAIQANTMVDLFKPAPGGGAMVLHTSVTLKAQEAFMLEDMTNDLTGWKVVASQPVAVFSGHVCTEVQAAVSSSSLPSLYNAFCSHLYEQLPPVNLWGTNFHTLVAPSRSFNIYRLISRTAITASVNGTTYSLAGNGDFVEFNMTSTTAWIQCSAQCLLVHYIPNSFYDPTRFSDPDMTIVPPVEMYSRDYVLQTVTDSQQNAFTNNLVIIAEYNDATGISVNGITLTTGWDCINQTGYAVNIYSLGTAVKVEVFHANSNVRFLAFIAGIQWDDSYSYLGGWESGGPSAPTSSPPSCPFPPVVTTAAIPTVPTVPTVTILPGNNPIPPATTTEEPKTVEQSTMLAIIIPICVVLLIAVVLAILAFFYAKHQRSLRKKSKYIDPSKIYIHGHAFELSEIQRHIQRQDLGQGNGLGMNGKSKGLAKPYKVKACEPTTLTNFSARNGDRTEGGPQSSEHNLELRDLDCQGPKENGDLIDSQGGNRTGSGKKKQKTPKEKRRQTPQHPPQATSFQNGGFQESGSITDLTQKSIKAHPSGSEIEPPRPSSRASLNTRLADVCTVTKRYGLGNVEAKSDDCILEPASRAGGAGAYLTLGTEGTRARGNKAGGEVGNVPGTTDRLI